MSLHGNKERLQSGIWHSLLRVSLPSLPFLSFLTLALIEGARTGNRRCLKDWGKLAWAHGDHTFWECRLSRISWKKPKKTGQWDLKESQARPRTKLQVSWMFKEKRRNLGEDEGLRERISLDPPTHCHTPRWSAYKGGHPRGRHRLPEASWVGRLERWVSSGFRRDPVLASKVESYQGRDTMLTSGLHMQLHMCSPTYTPTYMPDTHIRGKKNKNKVKGKKRTREPRKKERLEDGRRRAWASPSILLSDPLEAQCAGSSGLCHLHLHPFWCGGDRE